MGRLKLHYTINISEEKHFFQPIHANCFTYILYYFSLCMWVLSKAIGKEKNPYSKTKTKKWLGSHIHSSCQSYILNHIHEGSPCLTPYPVSIKRSFRYNVPRTMGLTLHFSLKLSQMSNMQHSSKKTIYLTWVSKITARQCFHMAAAEKVPSRYSITVPPVTHRFSVEVFLRRYGFSWGSLNFTLKSFHLFKEVYL